MTASMSVVRYRLLSVLLPVIGGLVVKGSSQRLEVREQNQILRSNVAGLFPFGLVATQQRWLNQSRMPSYLKVRRVNVLVVLSVLVLSETFLPLDFLFSIEGLL